MQQHHHTPKTAAANETVQAKSWAGSMGSYHRDNRPGSVTQRKLNGAHAAGTPPLQRKSNSTGLPDNLKSGIENLSGHSMDDVKVHYNSSKPAQLNAHAYAQGNQIHVAPGQQKHVPHEAWHVVQQKQGRVRPTIQMKGKVNVNDDSSLEKEADVMGAKALQMKSVQRIPKRISQTRSTTAQLAATVAYVGGANPLVNRRQLFSGNRQRQVIPFGRGTAIRDRMAVGGVPGFGRNLGHIVGNGQNLVRPSVQNVAHSEPILIGRAYGAAQANPTWAQANNVIDTENANAAGVANRAHFQLFTERVPCVNCAHELAQARYDAQDTVGWNYNNTAGVTQSHAQRAAQAFPGFFFAVNAQHDWLLAGYRIHGIVAPKKAEDPKKEDPKKDDKKDDKKDGDSSKKDSGKNLSSAFGKPASSVMGSGSMMVS